MVVYGAIVPEPEPSDFPIGYGIDFIKGDYLGLSFLSSPIKGGIIRGAPRVSFHMFLGLSCFDYVKSWCLLINPRRVQ